MKTKTIVGVSVLLVSCAAVAADSPFEKGKTYNLSHSYPAGMITITAEIKDVKGKWLLINDQRFCNLDSPNSNNNECWVNSDMVTSAVEKK